MLNLEDIADLAKKCRDQIALKQRQAERGHDFVVDSHSLSSFKMLELLALARLGYPIWSQAERGGLGNAVRDAVQRGERPMPVKDAVEGPAAPDLAMIRAEGRREMLHSLVTKQHQASFVATIHDIALFMEAAGEATGVEWNGRAYVLTAPMPVEPFGHA